jgi:hypothetical protein
MVFLTLFGTTGTFGTIRTYRNASGTTDGKTIHDDSGFAIILDSLLRLLSSVARILWGTLIIILVLFVQRSHFLLFLFYYLYNFSII